VLCTTADSPAAARGLLTILPEIAHKHLVLVASVTDPGVLAAAHARGTVSQVYLAAAAERALAERERLANAIHRLGGDVVSAPPAELPPAVADRYLAYKAAGRL